MTTGRVTQGSLSATALSGLESNLSRLQTLQNQLSSGKQIQQPSDDPAGTVSAMTLRSRKAATDQYLRNIDVANGRLGVTDNALTELSTQLQSVRNLVIQSRSGALSSESQSAIAANITAIRSNVIDLYNTTYLDRPVFGGTVTGQTAVAADGTYVGNDQPVTTRLSDDATIRIDVTGSAAGANTIPGMIAQVASDITSSTGATDADLADLDSALSQIMSVQGDVGARESRINDTQNTITSNQLDLTSQISTLEDVDMPQAMMNLSAQQVGYQAALESAAKVQQNSLVDFLK